MADDPVARRPWQKLAWFVGIWAASIAALGLVSLAIKVMVKG